MHAKLLLSPTVKAFTVTFFLILFALAPARSQMRQLYVDQDADNQVQKFSFYSASEGYVAFYKWIGFTSDSGRTFVKKYITLNNVDFNGYLPNLTFGFGINGVKAFNKDVLIVYGDYGFVPAILYSTNGGTSFKLVFHSQYDPLQIRTGVMDMVFPGDGDVGFAVDADRILKTSDKGLSWSPVSIAHGSYLNNVQATGSTVIAYSAGAANTSLYYSNDYGFSWRPTSSPPGRLNAAWFNSAWLGWINVEDDGVGKTYLTSNGGLSWTQVNNAATPFLCGKMRFINDSTGYAIGGGFVTMKTSDGGKIWERLPRDNNYSYLLYSHADLQCLGNTQVWAGGGHGFIEMSTNAGGTPIPSAYFSIDTSGEWSTRIVKLQNFSRPGYQYKWLKNGTLFSTAYHTSFTHDFNKLRDTIQLIVANGAYADTAIQYVNYYPATLISSFTPTTTGKGTTVTIRGAGFTDAVSVRFGGIAAASFQVLSDTEITAIVGDGASGSVAVTTTHRYAELAGFTFVPPPDITSFSPAAAAAGSTVTISGKYFTGADGVLFGGIPAVSFSVVSDTEIKAVLGKGRSGKITVSTFGGTDEIDGFRTIPVIISFSPARGTNGSIITITGTGFDAVTAVSFGGVPAKSFVIDSVTGITAEVGPGASGSVKVSNADGNSSLPGFTYLVPPVITAVNPLKAPAGSTVIISGSNFGVNPADNVVYFGGVRGTVTAASATSLSVTVPAAATYSPVSVTVNELSAYSSKPFTVTFPDGGGITSASFAQRTDYIAGPDPMYSRGGAFADLNNDGQSEMLINSNTPDNVGIWQNNSAGGQLNFSVLRLPAGENANHIVTGDLDGDGLLDIVSGSDGPTVSVYRNTSTAATISFADKIVLSGGNVLIIDLDLDGKPELIAGANIYRNISSPGKIAFAPNPVNNFAVVTADIDGDGKPDLVNYSNQDGHVSVVRNTSTIGNISFAAPVSYALSSPSGVRVADFDGDNRPDLVLPSSSGSRLSIFKNTGSPGIISFAPAKEFIITSGPVDLAVGDLDGDGKVDIATAGMSTSQLVVYKNTSTATDISIAPGVGYSTPYYPQQIGISDLNGDSKPEILVIATGRTLYVFTNNVKREPQITSFSPTIAEQGTTVTIKGNNFNTAPTVSFGGTPAASFTINSDTMITAVVGTGASGEVAVTNNKGTGIRQGFVFGLPPVITSCTPAYGPVGSRVTINGHHFGAGAQNNVVYFGAVKASIVSATADAIVAVVPTGTTPEPLTVITNGRSAYAPQPFIVTFTTADTTFSPASFVHSLDMPAANSGCIADFDNDGKLDIVYPDRPSGIQIRRNISTPEQISFAAASSFTVGTDQAIASVAADLNNDGKLDLMVSHGDQTALLKNTSTTGNISFTQDTEMTFAAGSYSKDLADLDGDGYPDLAVSDYGARALVISRNISHNGVIAMAERVGYLLDYYPNSVSIADLDGDGKPEVIIAGSGNVTVYRNISIPGTIILDKPLRFAAPSVNVVHASDIDGDGKKDIVVSADGDHLVVVLRNNSSIGNIAFEAAQPYTSGTSGYSLAIGDLNGDNKADVVSDISVLKNISSSGKAALQLKTDYASGASAAAIGDVDGDGLPDIVSFKQDYNVSIFRNRSNKAVYMRLCAGMDTTLTSSMTGTRYQWQEDAGSGFVNIKDNAEISGTTTNKLRFNDIQVSRNGYSYRCLVNDSSNREYMLRIGNGSGPVFDLLTTDSIICSGQRVLFVTYVTNGGVNPVYQWLLNGKIIPGETGSTFASTTLKNGDRVSVMVTNSDACIPTTRSNTITMQVREKVRAGGKAHAPFREEVDAVFPVTLEGVNIPKDALIVLYGQLDNGPFNQVTQMNADGASSVISLLSHYNPTAGVARFYFQITPVDMTCIQAGTSDTVTVRIETPTDSTVIIPLCENGNVTFASGLTAATYQWQQDKGSGFAAISDNANFTGARTATLRLTNVPFSWLGYRYRCVTGTPNKAVYQLQMTRNVVPSVSISTANTTVCSGLPVIFYSSAFNAGDNPGYRWLVNNVPADSGFSSYHGYPKNGDVVTLQLTSNISCPTPATVTSNTITMDVTEEPVITASGFTLTISAGYRSDAAYKWQILEGDWRDVVPAATKQHYYATQPGTYRVSVSKGTCAFNSNGEAVVITAVSPDPDLAAGIQLYPNPVQTDLNINSLKLSDQWETLDIMDIDGKTRISRFSIAGQTKVTLSIAQLNSGSYLAVLRRKHGAPVVKRFIKL